jgi:hypothetical protein
MTEGVIARFRTMDISRSAVLAGHVLGNTLQQVVAVAVTAIEVPQGSRPSAILTKLHQASERSGCGMPASAALIVRRECMAR